VDNQAPKGQILCRWSQDETLRYKGPCSLNPLESLAIGYRLTPTGQVTCWNCRESLRLKTGRTHRRVRLLFLGTISLLLVQVLRV
jgi:predicted nucleic acid-binding Zn ribbon protein